MNQCDRLCRGYKVKLRYQLLVCLDDPMKDTIYDALTSNKADLISMPDLLMEI